MADLILQLDEVSKRYGPAVTADRFSLAVERGEFFTFLGPSGSGKSTILRMIAGLEEPDSGRVLIGGRNVAAVPPWQRNLGMVFQHYAVFPHMSVADNVGYGLGVRRVPAAARRERAEAMLRLVGLGGMGDKNVTLLSGGEQQRVALARALVLEPTLLLLDEPLSALDEKIRREMQSELKHIQQQTGTTFLYVTHDQEEALTMSDRIAVLNRGVCLQCDAPERLFRRPRTRFVAGFFRGCNVLDATVAGRTDDGILLRFAGAEISVPATGWARRAGERSGIAIRAEDLAVGPEAARFACRLPATLEEAIYRGTNVDHVLRLDDGQRLVAALTRRAVDRAPARVEVGFAPGDVVPLED
jgi:ABC-type Fe3+/spermidine/putrescine transport system ATPase subunit